MVTDRKSTAWMVSALFLANALMLTGFYFITVGLTDRVCEEVRELQHIHGPAIMGLQPPTGEEPAESPFTAPE